MHKPCSKDLVLQICRSMRGSLPTVHASSFVGASPEDVCEKFEQMILDLLNDCPKPLRSLLQSAAERAYVELLSKDECRQLADRLLAAISFCKRKPKA